MNKYLFHTLIILLVAGVVCLVYLPLYEEERVLPAADNNHPMDTLQPGIEGEIHFCSDEWPPYVNSPDSEHEGYVVELLRQIYEPLGFSVKVEILPWSLCLHQASQGKVAGVIGTDTTEAPDLMFPQETMGAYRPQFYALPSLPWSYRGIDSLSDVRVGVAQDYSYSDEMDAYIAANRNTDRLLFSKGDAPVNTLLHLLENGAIDVFVENQATVDALLAHDEKARERIRTVGTLMTDESMYVAFSPEDQRAEDLSQRFDRRLERLRSSGVLAQILAAYGLKDWQVAPDNHGQARGE